jgi:hypothetical protein
MPRPEPATPREKPLATLGRGGAEHKYLQHLVKRLSEERGFRATIEAPASEEWGVDVVLRRGKLKIGRETSITTDADHEIVNLKKFDPIGFARIVFICPDNRRRTRVLARSLGRNS